MSVYSAEIIDLAFQILRWDYIPRDVAKLKSLTAEDLRKQVWFSD
jgi:hypothetical protein